MGKKQFEPSAPGPFTIANTRKSHAQWKTWPKEKKLQAVAQWLQVGSLKVVAEMNGIPYDTIKDWRGMPWWEEFVREIRNQEEVKTDHKISRIIDLAMDATEDRLVNGELVLNNKTGEVIRKQVALRDVHKVATEFITKRELLRGNATARTSVQNVSVQDQLTTLAQEFAKMVNPKKETIDVDVVEINRDDVTDVSEAIIEQGGGDALHEKWKAGLQETDGMAEPAGSSPETSGEQQSSTGDD
jgi:hypothetical protein